MFQVSVELGFVALNSVWNVISILKRCLEKGCWAREMVYDVGGIPRCTL